LVKGTQDGLSAAGFWVNDAQIFDGRVAKYYAERGGKPRIIVAIEEAPKHPPKFRQPEAMEGRLPLPFDRESIVW
jgi:hypothetical protein